MLHLSLLQKKGCFLNKTTQTSPATINTYNSNFNADTPLRGEAHSSDEGDHGIRKGRRKSNV